MRRIPTCWHSWRIPNPGAGSWAQRTAVQYFRQQKFSIDYLGLAQHYGLQTDILDLTVDPDIALFFAMCDYDPRNDRYTAKSQEREYIGYLYAINVFSYTDYSPKKLENLFTSKLKAIGLQPFDRPGNQKAFSLHLDEGEKLKGQPRIHSITRSRIREEYCRKYAYLWRSDMLSERTKSIRDTKIYSHQALSLATKKWGDGKSRTLLANDKCGINNALSPPRISAIGTLSLPTRYKTAVSEMANHPRTPRQIPRGSRCTRRQTHHRAIRQTGCNTTLTRYTAYARILQKFGRGGFPCVPEDTIPCIVKLRAFGKGQACKAGKRTRLSNIMRSGGTTAKFTGTTRS